MNKLVFSISLCLCVGFTAIAQDSDAVFTNKRGIAILPNAGDFAIGIDATPMLNYLGSVLSNNNATAPSFQAFQNTVYGKYFLENNRALRARLTIDLTNTANKSYVTDHKKYLTNPATEDKVIDVEHFSKFAVKLGVGYEIRRGYGRLQGFYGGEVSLGLGGGKEYWERGNAITTDIRNPFTCTNFTTGAEGQRGTRDTEIKHGKTFSFGLGGFAGVEYFFAPKISIGGELGLGLSLNTTGEDVKTTENWNVTDNKYQSKTVKSFSSSPRSITFGDTMGGKIFILFHF